MATDKTVSNPPQWTVTAVVPRVSIVGGSPVNGHNVSFVTAAGNRSEVFVPDTVANVSQARDIIAAQASFVDSLAALNG